MKTDKAKLLHSLEANITLSEKPNDRDVIYIYDGNALLQDITGLPDTFEELAEKILDGLPKVERLDFVTDTYKEDSIKSTERKRGGSSETFLITGPRTKIPRDWKAFMCNSENKKQLIKLPMSEWEKDKFAHKLVVRRIFFSNEEQCVCISSNDGESVSMVMERELFSSQEEADTRMVLHLLHADRENAESKTLIIRSPDTDVFILLLTFCPNY